MIRLGVNIDHVATVRQARRVSEPDPVAAAVLAELGGADGITVHLRQDRRHIQERDVRVLRQTIATSLNLEMAVGEGVLALALELKPHWVCLVPEHRQEITTEGGLTVGAGDAALRATIRQLTDAGTKVSLFIDPDPDTVRSAQQLGAHAVELHTGSWAQAYAAAASDEDDASLIAQERRLEAAAAAAASIGLRLHAGHGIGYRSVERLLHLPLLRELNIGHAIVSRALLVGFERAVREMRQAIDRT
jgi:pyridoxine 5-phosphate synthase